MASTGLTLAEALRFGPLERFAPSADSADSPLVFWPKKSR